MIMSSKVDNCPRPEVLPGAGGLIRTPNSNDVLSGRGGRINSHAGNVRFREMVESLKREYLDPRTKKVEKARIAARLVTTIRHSEPPGRFLKEDSTTGLWTEIGDERAWKKSSQALRESAPEIRAEQQAQLQAAVERVGGVIPGISKAMPFDDGRAPSTSPPTNGHASSGRGRPRQACDPPGPRHRPNPPEREGLARREIQQQPLDQYQQSYQQVTHLDQRNQRLFEYTIDEELNRMKREFQLQQRMNAHIAQLSHMHGDTSCNDDIYRQVQCQQQQQQMQQHTQPEKQRGYSSQEIAAAILDEGLLPVDAGFVIPTLREQPQNQYKQQITQNQRQVFQQCYPVDENNDAPHFDEVFNGRQFFSSDKTVSTISSFDVQSMDMSSLGGFSFANRSNANFSENHDISAMSGLLSSGSHISHSGAPMARKHTKSSLERKLEKVNKTHLRLKTEDFEKHRLQVQQMPCVTGDTIIEVPTQHPMQSASYQNVLKSHKYMMSSIGSFGFDNIAEEDHHDETVPLDVSEMDLTFSSTALRKHSDRASANSTTIDQKTPSEQNHPVSDSLQDNNQKISSLSSKRDYMPFEESFTRKSSLFDENNFNESLRSMDLEDHDELPPPPLPHNFKLKENGTESTPYALLPSASSKRRQREPAGETLTSLTADGRMVDRSSSYLKETYCANYNAPEDPRKSADDLDVSDPNITAEDFGISLNSIRSFQSHESNASSWLDQYQSMENVTGKNPWDEESGSSSLSEISVPRMTVANRMSVNG